MTGFEHSLASAANAAQDDGFPADEAVLGAPYALPWPTIHPIGQPDLTPHATNRLWTIALWATIGVSLIGLIVAAGVIVARIIQPGPALDTTFRSAALRLTLDHPHDWFVTEQRSVNLFGTPGPAVLLADHPLSAAAGASRATLVLAVQRVVPGSAFGVPAPCRTDAANGPHAAFTCMAQAGYAVPVFDAFKDVPGAARLAGALPPTPATRPVILLPANPQEWIAITIIFWDGFDDARGVLAAVTGSIAPTR